MEIVSVCGFKIWTKPKNPWKTYDFEESPKSKNVRFDQFLGFSNFAKSLKNIRFFIFLKIKNSMFFFTCQVRVSDLQSSVGTAGPQPRAPDFSGQRRASTMSARSQCAQPTSATSTISQWALPGLNRELQISVGSAGPQPRALDRSVRSRPQPRAPYLSGHCRASTASSRS